MKRESCIENVCMADGTKKAVRYHVRGQLTNEFGQKMEMNIWITELEEKDIIIEQDWLEKLKLQINWKTKTLEISSAETEEIPG